MNDRRRFCLAGLTGLALTILPRRAHALAPGQEARANAPERPGLSLAQWSLHRALQSGELDPLDFPREARQTYGIDAVEYVNRFYAEHAADFDTWRELRRRCEGEGVESVLIMVDGEGRLGAADAAERRRACERHFRWIAAAAFLGCHAIRVNAEGEGSPEEHAARVAESLHALAEVGADYGVSVLVENHGGRSSNGAWLAKTLRLAAHPGVGALPDFGNFWIAEGEQYDPYRGTEELMPLAKAVSAKAYDFGPDGEETTIDFARMLEIVLASGYRGRIGIEYEGKRLSEHDGIVATKRLLERLLS